MRIIPAIDMRDGNCVRLLQGDFARQTHYSDDPAAIARQFAGMGFADLHLVDLDGARTGQQGNRDLVRRIVAAASLDTQVGGGIRDRDTAAQWFGAGVARVVIGSLAVTQPDTVIAWMREFGAGRIVLALDCRTDDSGEPLLATHGWTRNSGVTLWQCLERYADAGALQVLCTDVSRDGAMAGPSFALYETLRRRYPEIVIQASGGVRGLADLQQLRDLGVDAAITGRALLDGCITDEEVRTFLQDA